VDRTSAHTCSTIGKKVKYRLEKILLETTQENRGRVKGEKRAKTKTCCVGASPDFNNWNGPEGTRRNTVATREP